MTFIVGFTGRAGVGKDTAGAVLVNSLGFTRFGFADPIKRALEAMMGWDPYQWNDREWKENNLPNRKYSPRFLAQTLGTEWGRLCVSNNFWIEATESLIAKSQVARVVLTDVRFDNEAKWIQSRGGWVIEIRRDASGLVHDTALHISEGGVSPNLIDFTIHNFGAKGAFESMVYSEVHAKLAVSKIAGKAAA